MTLGKIYKKIVLELSPTSPSPELDAKVLIQHVLAKDAAFVISNPKMPLTNTQYSRLRRLINRRVKGEPIAYITGHKEFYGLDFYVNKNVLIPRPETENLIEEAIKFVGSRLSVVSGEKPQTTNHQPLTILDMGTGSGCMIIFLAKELDRLYGLSTFDLYASDISPKALRVARKNAKNLLSDIVIARNEITKQSIEKDCHAPSALAMTHNGIRFYHSDLFRNRLLHKKPTSPAGGFDLIIANLPYVPYPSIPPLTKGRLGGVSDKQSAISNKLRFEPQLAIFANDNGTSVIKRFLEEARNRLTPDGAILLELDPRNAQELDNYARKLYPTANIELKKDLAGHERYLKICL